MCDRVRLVYILKKVAKYTRQPKKNKPLLVYRFTHSFRVRTDILKSAQELILRKEQELNSKKNFSNLLKTENSL